MVTKRLTLRDVITHVQGVKSELSTEMQNMEKRLTKKIDANTESIGHNTRGIRGLHQRVDVLEKNLTDRIDALEEDLTATMKDSVKIRRHVGMAVPRE